LADARSTNGGFSVPWELVRIRKEGRELPIRYPRFVSDRGEPLDELVSLAVEASTARVRVKVVLRASPQGGTAAYPVASYGTVTLRRPLGNRDLTHAAVHADLFPDGGRDVLDTLRELPSGRAR
jgi:hypothetical protein